MKNSSLIGSLPKIGIRPTIDGRLGGVRESLEKQTMDMAKSAAKLISSSLRYPNGKRVECVIADTCIGGVAEAAACAEKFAREGVGAFAHRHAVLVLRQRDDGHEPDDSEGGVGLQRHGTARRGLSGGGAGGSFAKGPARVQHLRPRRAGRRRQDAFPPMCPRRFCNLPAPVLPWRRCAANPISAWAASRWASPAPSWTSRSSRATSA